MKKPSRRISISFTERELYLLSNGFSTSFQRDEDDPDCKELGRISDKLSKAEMKFYQPKKDKKA